MKKPENHRFFCKGKRVKEAPQAPCATPQEKAKKTLFARAVALLASPRALVGACYAFALVLCVAWGAISAVWDAACYHTGRFTTQTITLADSALYQLNDFTLVGEDVLLAQTGDPSILLMPNQQVRRITAVLEGDGVSAERDLYYHFPGLGYSPALRVWPTMSPDATAYIYELPLLTGQNIRLDLCDRSGASVRVLAFIINEPVPVWAYFIPSAWACFWLCFLPAIAACALLWGRDLYTAVKAQQQKNVCAKSDSAKPQDTDTQ